MDRLARIPSPNSRLPLPSKTETTPAMNSKLIAFAAAVFLPFSLLSAESVLDDTMQKPQSFKKKITSNVSADYLLFLPKGYEAKGRKRWPLMLFLHGAGERGTNLSKVTVHGPPKIVKNRPDFPFILVSPQCPEGEVWSNDTLLALLDEVIRKHKVDTNRIYLTGLSMGGYGTWSLGIRYPDGFAAIAPICGGGETISVLLAGRQK